MVFKEFPRKPVPKLDTYLKFGFVITEHMNYYCPRCGEVLNAGPNYQPKYCDQCGQRVDFSEVKWMAEKELGYAERSEAYEQI